MIEITASVALTAESNWSVLQLLPIRYTVAAETTDIVITLPEPTKVVGGQTQLSFEVTDLTKKVTFAGADGVTVNGVATLDVAVVGTYVLTIGSETNYLLTAPYIPTV